MILPSFGTSDLWAFKKRKTTDFLILASFTASSRKTTDFLVLQSFNTCRRRLTRRLRSPWNAERCDHLPHDILLFNGCCLCYKYPSSLGPVKPHPTLRGGGLRGGEKGSQQCAALPRCPSASLPQCLAAPVSQRPTTQCPSVPAPQRPTRHRASAPVRQCTNAPLTQCPMPCAKTLRANAPLTQCPVP